MDFGVVLGLLNDARVDYIVIGGVAAALNGSARLTSDLDVVYSRSDANLERVVAALAPHKPYLRGAPPGLPFHFDTATLRRGLNFTLTTDLGPIDLLGEVTGGGSYDELLSRSFETDAFGVRCRCLEVDALIATKRAAGRPRDLETIAELETIRDLRARPGGSG